MKFISFFHQFKALRQIAKVIGGNINIKQKFYSGYIFLNAVEHSWAWTGDRNYNNFDLPIQQYIHKSAVGRDIFVDIGSNIGVMTLGTLLNNNMIKAVAIDPNKDAIKLLNKSLIYNKISDRCITINAVVGDYDGKIKFDSTGSVTGHVSKTGKEVSVIKLSSILNQYKDLKTLVKVDIEGYETQIIKELEKIENLNNFKFIIELHPLGFNDVGNPEYVFNLFKNLNGKISDLNGVELTSINQNDISQISVEFID